MDNRVMGRLAKGRKTEGAVSPMDAVSRALFFAGTGQVLPQTKTNSDSLSDRLALEQYKQQAKQSDPMRTLQMKNIESQIANRGGTEPEGYESEDDIPQDMAGLPIKQVSLGRGGRLKPTYGYQTPLVGGFDMQEMVDSFSQPQQQQPQFDDEGSSYIESVRQQIKSQYPDATDDEIMDYLEALAGGNQ